jgi:23S rRNA (uracil1939-C5)-methyltransferase
LGRKKKTIQNLLITGIADKGKAVGRTADGEVVFVEGAVPGDVIDVLILRKKKSMSEGVVTKLVSLSPDRIDPVCHHFVECGGCKWQDLTYTAQLRHKEQIVRDCMRRIGRIDDDKVLPILGSDLQFLYRNKLEFSFSTKRWITNKEAASDEVFAKEGALGFHRAGFFDKIVNIDRCHLQADLSNDIRNFVRIYASEKSLPYYDPRTHEGLMRNMIVRNNLAGEWMLNMVFGYNDEAIIPLMNALHDAFPQITSLNYVINTKVNDTIFDLDIITYKGAPYIIEQLEKVKYKIGTKSFFQTNTTQAIRLFDVAVEMADLSPTDNVYDLYTGLGSIALYISDKVKHVTGIEEIPEAIADAHVNMELNGIKNATFYAGDVRDILNDDFIAAHGKADIVITDPPRAGMHEDVVNTLLTLEASRIVYISCNPATQARDLALLSVKYDIDAIKPVDMFPHTSHIESVAKLTLRVQ